MKEKEKSQEEVNKEVARRQWDNWITDSKKEEEETQFDEYGNSGNGNEDS